MADQFVIKFTRIAHRTQRNPHASSWELMTSLLALCQWNPLDTGGIQSQGEVDVGASIVVQLFAWTNYWTNIPVAGLRGFRSHLHNWNFDRLSYSFKLERWFIYSIPRRTGRHYRYIANVVDKVTMWREWIVGSALCVSFTCVVF